MIGGRTDFVEDEDELLALTLASSDLLLDQSAATALGIARVEDQNDNIAFVDNFVQRSQIMSPQLLLGFFSRFLVGQIRQSL